MKKSTILITVLMTSFTFGQTPPKQIKILKSARAMKQELDARIPAGSNITDAQQILQTSGFKCQMKQQGSFIEIIDNKSVVEHNNMDFLFCDKSDHLLINTRVWQIAVVHTSGVVSGIFNSVDTSPVLRRRDYIHMSDTDIKNILLKYAPLGSSEEEVKRMLREVFHRSYKKNSDYSEKYPCYDCPKEKGGFALNSKMQHYHWRILEVEFVWAVWYFDKNGVLKEVVVNHEWDGV